MSRNGNPIENRISIGRAVVPVQFGEQVIVSLLYNHDANPVHHRPDHAIQWMLGLLASQGVGGTEESLEDAGPEERTYTLGAKLLARQDVVVMPGIVLAAICYERFVPPTELTASITTTFTYPLLVPTKGAVEVSVEAYELPLGNVKVPGGRNIQIEAFGPGISGTPVRLLKLEAQTFRAGTSPERVFEEVVAPQFADLSKLAGKMPEMPSISHPSSISIEDRRRFSRIVEPGAIAARPITESAWQCKIPRVLTEVIEHLRYTEQYQREIKAYYQGREDEVHRREAIKRLVEKERRYNWVTDDHMAARVEELAQLAQHLYARQHTVFDPRCFRENGAATAPGAQMHLDLNLCEIRLRRGIHRLFTSGRLKQDPVLMGEATVMAQPLVTRDLANFLCEVNYSFDTLKLFQYKREAPGIGQ
jgi:hypothetical protein